MHRQTAVDALIDAGRDVAAAVGAESTQSAGGGAATSAGTLVVGTLLALAVPAAPVLVVAFVGYAIVSARDPDTPIAGFDDWAAIGTAGVRGTGLLAGAVLPGTAALVGSGRLDIEAGSVVLGAAPDPTLTAGIAALAVATWHAAVVGVAAVAAGREWSVARGARFGWSAPGVRLSAALGGLTAGVAVVGFGLTAIPVVGPVLAAGVCAVGVAVAGRLVGRAVAEANRQSGSVGWGTAGDRLAVPTDSSAAIRRDEPEGEMRQHDNGKKRGRTRPTATPRRSRRERP
jgi:hypothetical protein